MLNTPTLNRSQPLTFRQWSKCLKEAIRINNVHKVEQLLIPENLPNRFASKIASTEITKELFEKACAHSSNALSLLLQEATMAGQIHAHVDWLVEKACESRNAYYNVCAILRSEMIAKACLNSPYLQRLLESTLLKPGNSWVDVCLSEPMDAFFAAAIEQEKIPLSSDDVQKVTEIFDYAYEHRSYNLLTVLAKKNILSKQQLEDVLFSTMYSKDEIHFAQVLDMYLEKYEWSCIYKLLEQMVESDLFHVFDVFLKNEQVQSRLKIHSANCDDVIEVVFFSENPRCLKVLLSHELLVDAFLTKSVFWIQNSDLSVPFLAQLFLHPKVKAHFEATPGPLVSPLAKEQNILALAFLKNQGFSLDHLREIHTEALNANNNVSYSESAMKQLSYEQIALCEPLITHYASQLKPAEQGIDVILVHLAQLYNECPALDEQGRALPLDLGPESREQLSTSDVDAYLSHPVHTAYRYLLPVNPLIDPNAEYACEEQYGYEIENPHDGNTVVDHWRATCADIPDDKKYLFQLMFYACTDEAVTPLPGWDRASILSNFVDILAELCRAHNMDAGFQRRIDANDNDGPSSKALDDGRLDNPSCAKGIAQRSIYMVLGHPYFDIPEVRPLNPQIVVSDTAPMIMNAFAQKIREMDANSLDSLKRQATDAMINMEPVHFPIEVSEHQKQAYRDHKKQWWGQRFGLKQPICWANENVADSYDEFVGYCMKNPWKMYYKELMHELDIQTTSAQKDESAARALLSFSRLK